MMPAVTDGSQSKAQLKPVLSPKSKMKPMIHCNNNNSTVETTADTTSNTTKAVPPADSTETIHSPTSPRPERPPRPSISSKRSCYAMRLKFEPPADSTERVHSPTSPRPERPPRPFISNNRSCFDESQYSRCSHISSTPPVSPAATKEESPADSTERIHSPTSPRPERPPRPSISYNTACYAMRLKTESCVDESQQSRCPSIKSMQQPPVSPAVSKEEAPDRPAVPPRLGLSAPKSIPPPPSFIPPPPPSVGKPSDTVYSKTEHRPYLTILPKDEEKMVGCSISQQTIKDTEDINGMLRWLKRVSKSDFMGPPVFGLCLEEVMRSFSQRAMAVCKARRLYNLLMLKRNESLQNIITEFSSISDSLDKLEKKCKVMDIAGGTTGAVGGVTAVLGIALAPATLGTSLIATAVGAGMVATAGGMGAHSFIANKKIVSQMAVEKLVYEYKENVVDLENCLSFILSGMNELRMHDITRLQRAGAQAEMLKVAYLSQSVLNNMNKDGGATVSNIGGMSSERLLLAFLKELDQYFTGKDGLTLKTSHKSRFSVRVRLLAENLQDELNRMNCMWEMFS